jgi:hypothetical protein
MSKIKPRQTPSKERKVFNEALASALSVSRDELRKRRAEAKVEKTSKHKRWKYVPEGVSEAD